MKTGNVVIAIEGSIGDTIAVLPIIDFVKRHFSPASVGIIHFGQGEKISEEIVMHDIPLADFWFAYPSKRPTSSPVNRLSQKIKVFTDRIKLAFTLRKKSVTTLVFCYQMFTYSPKTISKKIRQTRRFAKLAGIKKIIGLPIESEVLPLSGNKNVTSRLCEFLRKDGVPINESVIGNFKLPFSRQEEARAELIAEKLNIPDGATPFAICVGGKARCNHWPVASWKQTLSSLGKEQNLFPVFFGSTQDKCRVNEIMEGLGLPSAFISEKDSPSLRTTMLAMQKICRGYIGHDTGLLHAASCVGLPVVGIYSAHDYEGLWTPRKANKHIYILRKNVECENCRLSNCHKDNLCIKSVSPDEVISSVTSILSGHT